MFCAGFGSLAPGASASTRLQCLEYIGLNVPLSTYCKIRYLSTFTASSRGSSCDSTVFLVSNIILYHLSCVLTTAFYNKDWIGLIVNCNVASDWK